MKVVPLAPEGLRVGRLLPFSIREEGGKVLIARGSAIENPKQLEHLLGRPLFVDANESVEIQRAYNGQIDQMFLQDRSLGAIARAAPDYRNVPLAARTAPERGSDWRDLQMRLRLLLIDPKGDDWAQRLRAVRDEAMGLVTRHPDHALLRLMHDASTDYQHYSANHALFVSVICALAAANLPGFDKAWLDPLTLAALTMNLSITSMQDEMARQDSRPTAPQRSALLDHGIRSATTLRTFGVTSDIWLDAVTHHHDAPPGKIVGLPPGELCARLIRRADRYAARLSPRKSRPASTATAAAQTAFFDEGGHHDEAGQALVKTLGLYPPGVWVKLQCGELALVLRRGPQPKAPVVASLVSRSGMPMAVPALRNTRLPNFEVQGAVAPGQIRVLPNLDALERLA
jgi:hypothetical protein